MLGYSPGENPLLEFAPHVLLADFPVVIRLPIQWGDQDLFGHVNNTVYIRWFESARQAYGDRIGLSEIHAKEHIGPILAAVGCNYRQQLMYPDSVQVGARVTKIGRSSMRMEYRVVGLKAGTVAADGDSTIVAFDYIANKPVNVPPHLVTTIEQLEGRPLKAAPALPGDQTPS